MKIGLPVLEKIFEGFLLYIYRAWRPSWSCDSNAANKCLFPPIQGGFTYNLALIRQAVLEKMFENVNGRTTTDHGYPIRTVLLIAL